MIIELSEKDLHELSVTLVPKLEQRLLVAFTSTAARTAVEERALSVCTMFMDNHNLACEVKDILASMVKESTRDGIAGMVRSALTYDADLCREINQKVAREMLARLDAEAERLRRVLED